MKSRTLWLALMAAALLSPNRFPVAAQVASQAPAQRVSSLDDTDLDKITRRVFGPWSSPDAPGCAVGIDRPGYKRWVRAFGAADLEFGIANSPESIFEAGSISKQFTAAAVVLLAIDGKLGLEDDIRRYVPELPPFPKTITIRHLLNHTSGIRDWGDIAAMNGWPRGTRAYTHDDVLEILARQRDVNYPAGERYSYTNSGYNLLAIIVSRVSGEPFADFSQRRLFKPLGLTRTSWRDDFTRVVKGRSQAYQREADGWHLDMPFENVHGNGGLLTTVSDLLTWTAVLDAPSREWKAMADSMHVRGILTNGDTIPYALGLFVDRYRGLPRVEHSGATAGYRADLARFPDRHVAIAILCNAASANPGAQLRQLSDTLLAAALRPATVAASAPAQRLDSVSRWTPTDEQLRGFTGSFFSADVGNTLTVTYDGEKLVLFRPSATKFTLRPTRTDRFSGAGQELWFSRNAQGRVDALHLRSGRAYDVVYDRVGAATP